MCPSCLFYGLFVFLLFIHIDKRCSFLCSVEGCDMLLLLSRLICRSVFASVLFCWIFDSFTELCWPLVRRPTERERTECLIKAKLRNIMTFQDLENITSKEVGLTRPSSDVVSYFYLPWESQCDHFAMWNPLFYHLINFPAISCDGDLGLKEKLGLKKFLNSLYIFNFIF